MKKIRIFLQYVAAFIVILLLIFLIASVVLVKFYGDDLKTHTMEMVNKQLDTKVSMGDVGISVLKKFPNTSVYLNDVMVWSGHQFDRSSFEPDERDTLLYADRIYLQFNMLKLLRKKFQIKGLEIHQGQVNLLIDKEGKSNFNVTKSPSEEEVAGSLDVSGFIGREMKITYLNHAKNLYATGNIITLALDGNFSAKEYMLNGDADVFIDDIINHGIPYVTKQEVKSSVSLHVRQNQYNIEKGTLNLGEISASVAGSFLVDRDTGTDLDLEISGRRIDLSWVSEILESRISNEGILAAKGKADLDIQISGLATTLLTPHIEATFQTSNAQFITSTLPVPLKSIELNGSYTNGTFNNIRSSTITLESFQAEYGASQLKGTFRMNNLLEPSFSAKIRGEIAARDLTMILKDAPVDFQSGVFKPDLHITGTFRYGEDVRQKLLINPAGSITFQELSLFPGKGSLILRDLSGQSQIAGKKMDLSLSGRADNSDFTGEFTMNIPLFAGNSSEDIKITGSLESSSVDIDALLKSLKTEKSEASGKGFPQNLYMDIDFSFQQISKGTIQTRKVNGSFLLDYPAIYIDPVYLETMNGIINTGIVMSDLHTDQWKMRVDANYRNVEIRDIFTSFNNFNQDFITDKHIAGSISGETQFFAEVNPGFNIPTEGIISENDFVIENGELTDFKPLIELSKFLKVDKMDKVAFSTLENTILIENNNITIPQMDIQSNAFNLQASGQHSFGKTFEYHVATKLSEILFKKAKNSRNDEFNIALDKDDQRTLFLLVYDEGNGLMIDFDEDQALKKIKQDMKDERVELKSILNKEFGLFKRDKDIQEENPKDDPVMQFQFEDDKTNDTLQDQERERTRWWKRNKETDKKPEFDFVIDED